MSEETINTGVSFPWQLSERGRELVEQIQVKNEARNEALKNSIQICPVHERQSKFSGLVGSFPVVIRIYECPEGHKVLFRKGVGVWVPPLRA